MPSRYLSHTYALRLGARFDLDGVVSTNVATFAPSADPAPAPAAPAAVPAPPSDAAAPLTPLQDLRQRMAAYQQQQAQGAQGAQPPAAPTDATHHSATQPRAENGQFAEQPPVADPAAPPADPATAPVEGEQAPAEGEGDESAEAIVIELPNRHPEQAPVPIEVSDPEVAERLRQLVNGFERGEQTRAAREEIAQQRAQLETIRTQLDLDPVGIVLEHAPPADRIELARSLVTDPEVFGELAQTLISFLVPQVDANGRVTYDIDPRAFKTAQIAAENSRLKRSRDTEQQMQARQASAQQARVIGRALDTIADAIPSLSDAQRAIVRDDLHGDVVQFLRQSGRRELHPHDVPQVLERRLAAYGLTPQQASQAMLASQSSASPAGAAPRTAAAPRPGSPPAAPAAATAFGQPALAATAQPAPAVPAAGQRTIAQIRAAGVRRAAVAAQAPSGAGAVTGPGTYSPPPGADLKSAISDYRATVRARRAPA